MVTKNIRFIGDVHGHFGRYNALVRDVKDTVQVGDMGVGFRYRHPDGEIKYSSNPSHYMMKRDNHRFIRGNHDNPEFCKNNSQWIPDGTVEDDVMFIGGAWSIDYAYRTEGLDWWRDEEISYEELDKLISVYEKVKPRVMVTHDAPLGIPFEIKIPSMFGNKIISTRTAEALKTMFFVHQPETWIFGHWHNSADKVINGTRFICLAELEYIDLEV